jgi:hypothetical protein
MLSHSLRRLFGTALATFALATAACGGGDGGDTTGPSAPAPVPADVSGTYGLTGVKTLGTLHGGGSGMPVTFTDGGGSSLTFNSGSLTLNGDHSYSLSVDATFKGSAVAMTDEGTWSLAGNSITFSPSGSPKRMKDGTVGGSKIVARTQFGGIPFEVTLQK